jgi:hypothetical protein
VVAGSIETEGGLHVHHLVFGILLMILTGFFAFATQPDSPGLEILAAGFGIGGQEEVFFAVSGAGEIEIDGERYPLDPETMVRVGPGVNRKIWPGDEPMRVLAIGGIPGKPYEPSELSKLGVPDPMAQARA